MRGQQGFDIARVVADSGRIDAAIANYGLDLQTRLKHGVQVRVERPRSATALPLRTAIKLPSGIVVNLLQLVRRKSLSR